MHELLTSDEMKRADSLTIEGGLPGIVLMENAGRAIFETATRMLAHAGSGPVLVACGPGNNGGDGFIAARLLAAHGFRVKLALAGSPERLSGDAATAFSRWGGRSQSIDTVDPAGCEIIVDALLGAGLDRPVSGAIGDLIEKINRSGKPVISADLPSGIDGDTGSIMGTAVRASHTVTFFRKKPGHILFPGRSHCGKLVVADIGIDDVVLEKIVPQFHENLPGLWRHVMPVFRPDGHKYERGHGVVVSGHLTRTGAARLAAEAALRSGAGLVTLASPADALSVNASQLTTVMLARLDGANGLAQLLSDKRVTAVAIGPAMGLDEMAMPKVSAALRSGKSLVLDADALTCFQDQPQELFELIASAGAGVVMTPHMGEFRRLFTTPDDAAGKIAVACHAAKQSGAVVVLKGADTIIASPLGKAAINGNAPPWLATAGAGDVLAGIICGLAAQGMPAFEAAAAGVWLHGAAAAFFGPGMVAEDIQQRIPSVLAALHEMQHM